MTDNQLREEMVKALQFVRAFYQDNMESMPIAFQSVDSYCELVLQDEEMNALEHNLKH